MDAFQKKGINIDLSNQILQAFNNGEFDHVKPVEVKEIPDIDGKNIIDTSSHEVSFTCTKKELNDLQTSYNLDLSFIPDSNHESVTLNKEQLNTIGTALMPFLAVGVLNGGSATSYGDTKKNSGFNAGLFELYTDAFKELAAKSKNQPKGIVPAYINPDGSHGYSFLELRMRNILIKTLEYQTIHGTSETGIAPFFQMTSKQTGAPLENAYESYKTSPILKDLISECNTDPTSALSAEQPLISAYTQGKPKELFLTKNNEALALPGGHGQNFLVLKEIYTSLLAQGKKFAYLGNVDNLGFTINPVGLALLALSRRSAAFEFSFKTAVDVKGGILITDSNNHLNCADIGVGIPKAEVDEIEKSGKRILFNCATGLFNLEYLCEHLDRIIKELPMRFSDQNKDAGKYSQAEQVTWEVLGIIEEPLILGVHKFDRFLAAKLLCETIMTSGYKLESIESKAGKDLSDLAKELNNGLQKVLLRDYGMKLVNNRWEPLSITELKERI